MQATGELVLTSLKTGTSNKSGKPYYSAKFLDSEAEEFVTFFIDEPLFHALEELPKGAPVIVTMNLALASKYFTLESVEAIEN